MLWLTVVAAIAMCWWVERIRSGAVSEANAALLKKSEEEAKRYAILEKQFGALQLKLAEEGYRFHFDIYQYPDGKADVRFVDESK